MKVIHKYLLKQTSAQQIEIPIRSHALHVGEQNGVLCMWALVDPESEMVSRTVHVLGTGHECDFLLGMERLYVGTAQMSSGLVWHVFEDRDPGRRNWV